MTGTSEAQATPFSGVHAGLSGLAADDHLQYALLAGRALGQTLHGGTAPGELLTLQGSSDANRGRNVLAGGATIDWDFTSDAVTTGGLQFGNTIPASGGLVSAAITIANNITVNNALFIMSALDDLTTLNQSVAPGFAVTTLFFARQTYRSTTFGVAPAQAFIYAAQCQYWLTGTGSVTAANYRALSFVPIIRVDNNGDQMHITSTTGLIVQPLYNTRNAGAVADYGTIRGVHMNNAGTVLFGQQLGSEIATNWIGVDCEALTGLVVSGRRAAVRSAIPSSANNRFLENLSGAASDFGGSHIYFNDNFGIALGTAGIAYDAWIRWVSARNVMAINFFTTGDDLDFSSPAANRFLISSNDNSANEINFDFKQFAFGQAGAVGNNVGLFVANARTIGVPGEWADFLLTQAGNLTVGGLAMSRVSAWVINGVSYANSSGTVSNAETLTVGGFPTSSPGVTITERQSIHVIGGRSRFASTIQYDPLTPVDLGVGDNDDYGNMLTGIANNGMRRWNRLTGNVGGSTITGIDAAATQNGDTIDITNVGGVNFTLGHQDIGSSAANRIISPSGADYVLGPDETAHLRYDGSTARWRILSGSGA